MKNSIAVLILSTLLPAFVSAADISGTARVSVEASVGIEDTVNVGFGAEGEASSSSDVRTEADLSGFVATEISADENISKIETSSKNVSVTYNQPAKLFGIIPVTVKATATVSAEGKVDVTYPWFAFMLTTNEANLEASIRNRIGVTASVVSAATADADTGFAAATQAEIISEVRAAMEANLTADASANSSAAL